MINKIETMMKKERDKNFKRKKINKIKILVLIKVINKYRDKIIKIKNQDKSLLINNSLERKIKKIHKRLKRRKVKN